MDIHPADKFYQSHPEPIRGTLLALREMIPAAQPELESAWKYSMPFFYFRNKMFCYLWVHKKYKQPYIGLVDGNKLDHPALLQEKRSRMKILLVDPEKDIDVEMIEEVLGMAMAVRLKG